MNLKQSLVDDTPTIYSNGEKSKCWIFNFCSNMGPHIKKDNKQIESEKTMDKSKLYTIDESNDTFTLARYPWNDCKE